MNWFKSLFSSASLFISTWRVYFIVGAIVVLTITSFCAGWKINGWKLGKEIVDIQNTQLEAEVTKSHEALDDLAVASLLIKENAEDYLFQSKDVSAKIDLLRKDVKNYAKANPLPKDCKPDSPRQESLKSAIDAANDAIMKK